MGFFSKPQNNEEENKQPPRNPSNVVAFRLLAIGYVSYLLHDIVKLYIAGGPDAPSLPVLILAIAVLGGGAIFLAVITYKEWKHSKVAYDQYMAELRAEAEAKRAAEEAAEAEEDLEDGEELLLPEETEETEE